MNEDITRLEALLDQLMAGIQDTLANGEVLSDEFQGLIAQELAQTMDHITQLRGQTQNTPQIPTQEPMISDNVRLIWILSGGQEDVFTDYLGNFPDPEFNKLLRNPAQLERVIVHLHQNNPINTRGIEQDGIPKLGLNSSNIYGMRYDANNNQLLVRFNNGSIYAYDNVPPQIYNLVSTGQASARTQGQNEYGAWWRGKNPSAGAALNEYIKEQGYPYQRVA